MTDSDAVVYLHKMREEYAAQLATGINPRVNGDYIRKDRWSYYQHRIEALDCAIVVLTTMKAHD